MSDDTRGPRERGYDDEVVPLMRDVRALCKQHGIRMIAAFDLDTSGEAGGELVASQTSTPHDIAGMSERLRNAWTALHPAAPTVFAFTVMTGKVEE